MVVPSKTDHKFVAFSSASATKPINPASRTTTDRNMEIGSFMDEFATLGFTQGNDGCRNAKSNSLSASTSLNLTRDRNR